MVCGTGMSSKATAIELKLGRKPYKERRNDKTG